MSNAYRISIQPWYGCSTREFCGYELADSARQALHQAMRRLARERAGERLDVRAEGLADYGGADVSARGMTWMHWGARA